MSRSRTELSQKPGLSTGSSTSGTEAQAFGSFSAAFLSTLADTWIGSETTGTLIHIAISEVGTEAAVL